MKSIAHYSTPLLERTEHRADSTADIARSQSHHLPLQRPNSKLSIQEMQTWRRTFATSVARLNHNPPTTATRPAFLRCAQLLRESKHGEKSQHENKRIEVRGLIRSVRKQKKFAFAEISDGSSLEAVQAILKPEQAAEYDSFPAESLMVRC